MRLRDIGERCVQRLCMLSQKVYHITILPCP